MKNIVPFPISLLLLGIVTSVPNCINKQERESPRVVVNTKKGLWEDLAKNKIELQQAWVIGGPNDIDESKIFYQPKTLALDSQGNIYVLDSGNNRIQKFAPDGRFISSIGRKGQGPGEFISASDIYIDGNDKIFIADNGNNRIHILASGGRYISSFRVDKKINGIVVDKSGNVFASIDRPDIALIHKYSLSGSLITKFGKVQEYEHFVLQNALNLNTITIDSRHNIFLTFIYRNMVQKYDTEGNLLLEFSRKRPFSAKYTWKWENEEGGTGHGGFLADSFETLDIVASGGIVYLLLGNSYLANDGQFSIIERFTDEGIYLDSFEVPCIFWSFLAKGESLYTLDFARTMDFRRYLISTKKNAGHVS
jgi:hypothetical protein